MSRAVVELWNKADRAKAVHWIATAPAGSRIELKAPRRSNDSNALLWVWLTELASKLEWHGLRLSPEDWKDLISAGLKRELRTVPNLTGDGFVLLGQRTSDMSKAEFSDLLALVEAFAVQQGVELSREPSSEAA